MPGGSHELWTSDTHWPRRTRSRVTSTQRVLVMLHWSCTGRTSRPQTSGLGSSPSSHYLLLRSSPSGPQTFEHCYDLTIPISANANNEGAGVSHFALVQYIPDVERHEPLDVGVLLASRTGFTTRFIARDEIDDWSIVERFCGLLEHELANAAEPSSELQSLATRRFPNFEVSAPRQITNVEDLELAVDELAMRLVATADTPAWY